MLIFEPDSESQMNLAGVGNQQQWTLHVLYVGRFSSRGKGLGGYHGIPYLHLFAAILRRQWWQRCFFKLQFQSITWLERERGGGKKKRNTLVHWFIIFIYIYIFLLNNHHLRGSLNKVLHCHVLHCHGYHRLLLVQSMFLQPALDISSLAQIVRFVTRHFIDHSPNRKHGAGRANVFVSPV